MNKLSARKITILGILTALVIVLQLFASAIPMLGVTLNFSLIPIALAGILVGSLGGALIGFICGLVVFLTAAVFGGEPSTAFFFQVNPVILTLMCIGKTTVAGLASGLVFKAINKENNAKRTAVAVIASSAVIPVINTGIYMLGIVLMKGAAAEFMGLTTSTAGVVFGVVFGLIWINFILEIVITSVFAPLISKVVKIIKFKG